MSRPVITEHRLGPAEAKKIELMCPHCYSTMEVAIPWGITAMGRQGLIGEAVIEHRKLCSGAPPEAERVYEIHYPRK